MIVQWYNLEYENIIASDDTDPVPLLVIATNPLTATPLNHTKRIPMPLPHKVYNLWYMPPQPEKR